jgi:hypothetical protein
VTLVVVNSLFSDTCGGVSLRVRRNAIAMNVVMSGSSHWNDRDNDNWAGSESTPNNSYSTLR